MTMPTHNHQDPAEIDRRYREYMRAIKPINDDLAMILSHAPHPGFVFNRSTLQWDMRPMDPVTKNLVDQLLSIRDQYTQSMFPEFFKK